MGSEYDNIRRSRRVGVRLESLRTGITPYQRFYSSPGRTKCTVKTVSSNTRLTSSQIYSVDIQALDEADALRINQDIYLERPSFISEKSHSTVGMETRVSHMETDVNDLKSDVTSLKSDVQTVNGKLDDLIDSMARLSALAMKPASDNPPQQPDNNITGASNINSPQQASQSNNPTNNQNQQMRNPGRENPQHRPGRQISPEDFLKREMDKDRFEYDNAGKYLYGSDFSSHRVIHKPYMYLYREGVSTIKQKVEARQSMTVLEYIDATLALLADHRAYHRDDYIDIMDHLRKLTRDSLERQWHAVRRWSQYVWDSIEAGLFTWADRDIIQDERVRMCLTASSISTTPSYTNANTARKGHALQEVVCRPYNTRMGCNSKESHMDGQVYALHVCTYCDSIGRSCAHSVRECERRLAHTRNDHPSQYNRNRFPQGYQHNAPQHQVNAFQQPPKNGY